MAETIDRKAFGLFLGRQREKLGLSQGALARACGISRPYLSQIETGDRLPSDEVLSKLLLNLGSPMQEFVAEVIGDAFTPEQSQAAQELMAPMQWLATQVPPEILIEFNERMVSLENMVSKLQVIESADADGRPQSAGPEGWLELSKEDRRLVQRLINRMRK